MSEQKRLRVLIIDDNAAQCLGLSELLHIDGMTTYTAFDGVRGLDMARALKPDAVMLDVNMPRMDGYQVCDALRSSREFDEMAIIFHSASENPCNLHGADSFLTYPLPISILTDVLRACVRRRRPGQEAA